MHIYVHHDSEKPSAEPYFKDTTTYWAIYAGTGDKLSTKEGIDQLTVWHRLVGLLVLCLQMYTSVVILHFVNDDFNKDEVPITVTWSDCDISSDTNFKLSTDQLKCESEVIDTTSEIWTTFWGVGIVYTIYSTGPFINLYYVFQAIITSICETSVKQNIIPLFCALVAFVQTILFTGVGSYALYQSLYAGNILEAVERGVGLLWIQDIDDYVYMYFNYQDKEVGRDEITGKQVLKGFVFVFGTMLVIIVSFVVVGITADSYNLLNLGGK